jgi:DMSO/TMAO reductase YedYZ molybdopterin-dependent catalytic subunit
MHYDVTEAVVAGFILWKRAKGQERINRDCKRGRGGAPEENLRTERGSGRVEREVETHNDLPGVLKKL